MSNTIRGLAFLCVLVVCSDAHADSLWSSEQDVREVRHTVDIRIEDGLAHYRVRRTFANQGERLSKIHVEIEKPHNSNVVALRLLADGRVHEGAQLLEEEAWEVFSNPEGRSSETVYRPRAMMTWRNARYALLHVFPILPDEEVMLEYDLLGEALYQDGAYHVSYPGDGDGLLVSPSIAILNDTPGSSISRLGQTLRPGSRVTQDEQEQHAIDECNQESWRHVHCHVMRFESKNALGIDESITLMLELDGAPETDQVEVAWGAPDATIKFDIEHVEGHTYRGTVRQNGEAVEDLKIRAGEWSFTVLDESDERHMRVLGLEVLRDEARLARFEPADMISLDSAHLPGRFDYESPHMEFSLSEATHTEPRASYAVIHHDIQSAMQMRFELPPVLSQVPDDLHVAVVLDRSRSMELLDDRDAVWSILTALGREAPDAYFDIILSDRHARSMFEKSVKGRELGDAIEKALAKERMTYRNGSDLELGVALAAQRLELLDRTHRRILLFTDEVLPEHWSSSRALGSLGTGDLLQVVQLKNDEVSLDVISESTASAFGRHVQMHGGVYFELGLYDYEEAEAAQTLPIGLLRPTRLEHIESDHPQFDNLPTSLDEGEGVSLARVIDGHRAPDRWLLKGMMWSTPVEIEFSTSAREERLMSSIWLGRDAMNEPMRDGFVQALATSTGALARGYALFAIKRSHDAATHRFARSMGGLAMYGTAGARCGGVHRERAIHARDPMAPDLDGVLKMCARDAAMETWSGEVDISMTYHEIVSVDVRGSRAEFDACVREKIWAMMPSIDDYEQVHSRFSMFVSLSDGKVHSTDL